MKFNTDSKAIKEALKYFIETESKPNTTEIASDPENSITI